jgi:hypothetical protein
MMKTSSFRNAVFERKTHDDGNVPKNNHVYLPDHRQENLAVADISLIPLLTVPSINLHAQNRKMPC